MKDLTKILCSYLPHGLKLWYEPKNKVIDLLPSHFDVDWNLKIASKPILRPLYQLTEKEINNLLEPELLRMHIKEGITPNYRRTDLEYLYFLHADVHNLIESGQAIDVNTLETNPYE